MAESRNTVKGNKRWVAWTVGALLLFFVALAGTLAVLARHVEPFLRAALIQGLENRFHTRVELDSFHVSLGNGLHGEWGVWATGRGLRIWPPQRGGGDRPLEIAVQSVPLIQLNEFRFHAPLSYKTDRPIRISMVRLSGLQIHIPPRSERTSLSGLEAAAKGRRPESEEKPSGTAPGKGPASPAPNGAAPDSSPPGAPAAGPATTPAQPGSTQAPAAPANGSPSGAGMLSRVQIERIECDRADLVLETEKPDKLPTDIAISRLRVLHIAAGGPMDFEADVLNPKPSGVVHTIGHLGPWDPDDPGQTTVAGNYRFPHADLSAFKGIAGILSSEGSYQGTLRNIQVQGQADVPNFRLTHFGNAMPLHTQFQAHVDGSDGDTWLDQINAELGQSHFTTRGKVVRVKLPETPRTEAAREAGNIPPPIGGHDIELKVDVPHGRIEDFLLLAGHTQTPLLTGTLSLKASLQIPPGPETVHRRMRIDGSFQLDNALFTNEKVRTRIRELSLRGQGRPGDARHPGPDENVASQMQGEFHMAHAVILFPNLTYDVPGASIHLTGNYELDGLMGFKGTARMQATVSQMVGGWKGFLLRPADRFFKHDGAGTEVGVEIKGAHDAPQFSIDLAPNKTHPENPADKHG